MTAGMSGMDKRYLEFIVVTACLYMIVFQLVNDMSVEQRLLALLTGIIMYLILQAIFRKTRDRTTQ